MVSISLATILRPNLPTSLGPCIAVWESKYAWYLSSFCCYIHSSMPETNLLNLPWGMPCSFLQTWEFAVISLKLSTNNCAFSAKRWLLKTFSCLDSLYWTDDCFGWLSHWIDVAFSKHIRMEFSWLMFWFRAPSAHTALVTGLCRWSWGGSRPELGRGWRAESGYRQQRETVETAQWWR